MCMAGNTRILIICTGNTCRSQMAEGFLRSFDDAPEVYSAGTSAEKVINAYAVEVMAEVGIDISRQRPEQVEKYLTYDFDFVITVCDDAREVCPVFTGNVKNRFHIGFEDPAAAVGTKEEVIAVYRKVRDRIKESFYEFYKHKIIRSA